MTCEACETAARMMGDDVGSYITKIRAELIHNRVCEAGRDDAAAEIARLRAERDEALHAVECFKNDRDEEQECRIAAERERDAAKNHARVLFDERNEARSELAAMRVDERITKLPELAPPSRSAAPWSAGVGPQGPWLARHVNEDERGGPEPSSDYDGSEPVWLGGQCGEVDLQIIADRLNAIELILAALDGQRQEATDAKD